MMELRKFTLVSNNTCYGPCPEPDEEVEQRLTLAANGRVWFSGYNFGHGFGDYEVGRKLQVNIGSEAAGRILDLLDRYFDDRAIVMLWQCLESTPGRSLWRRYRRAYCVLGMDLSVQ